MWRANYDMSPEAFDALAEKLWQQVKPLYQELHCHTRAELAKKYGEDKVPAGKPIPAQLLGNMWAQQWNNIYDDILKPYHGIQWLENQGRLRFEPHLLAALPGAHRAVAADLDGDGDLDVVASAFVGAANPGAGATPSLVWLEQTKRGRFVRHTLAAGPGALPTLDVGDVDQDGDLDIVAGRFLLTGRSEEWLEVWENVSPPKRAVP